MVHNELRLDSAKAHNFPWAETMCFLLTLNLILKLIYYWYDFHFPITSLFFHQSGFGGIKGHKGTVPLCPLQPNYFSTFSLNRCRIAATCALVASPCGIKRPLLPRMRSEPQAHCIIGIAYSLILSASM